MAIEKPLLFALNHPSLSGSLAASLGAETGRFSARQFPDEESYLRIETDVSGRHCIIVAELSRPNNKYLPLMFMAETLKELGASRVGLVAPYLCYLRQDSRFAPGEAVTSRIFARALSQRVDWLVTVDPHLHRYHALEEIYSIPCQAVQGEPVLADWLNSRSGLFLVGPDSESEQWVSRLSDLSGHPYVVGSKQRTGDHSVSVRLPSMAQFKGKTAVIIDDVISTGQTILESIKSLKNHGIDSIQCAAVHGVFADHSDETLLAAGLELLVTTNTVPHSTNRVDITGLLLTPVTRFLEG